MDSLEESQQGATATLALARAFSSADKTHEIGPLPLRGLGAGGKCSQKAQRIPLRKKSTWKSGSPRPASPAFIQGFYAPVLCAKTNHEAFQRSPYKVTMGSLSGPRKLQSRDQLKT